MLELIKQWWFVAFLIWLILWAAKDNDIKWLPHLLESVFFVILIGLFFLWIFWISTNL